MPIQILLPWAKEVVWLGYDLCVEKAGHPRLKWMLGLDFWSICAPWVRRKGGRISRISPLEQKWLPLTIGGPRV